MEIGTNTGRGYLDGVVREGLSQEDTSRLSGGGYQLQGAHCRQREQPAQGLRGRKEFGGM